MKGSLNCCNCFRYVKDTNLKANHNYPHQWGKTMQYVKDTNLKVNHNNESNNGIIYR